ncbi:hypothetical protein CBR_g49388 [Chara braunii]|uniref:Uncharacterized protein n=1 Tax=Chara braunii TaxID=69332 RepID=A0A388M4U0_CHABU|nr:hypothetical protein CBR_g49388 [Chara braunii]|eukprot:GBG89598.1 hypothetical protein CBR_g49388 [Chara braunii]
MEQAGSRPRQVMERRQSRQAATQDHSSDAGRRSGSQAQSSAPIKRPQPSLANLPVGNWRSSGLPRTRGEASTSQRALVSRASQEEQLLQPRRGAFKPYSSQWSHAAWHHQTGGAQNQGLSSQPALFRQSTGAEGGAARGKMYVDDRSGKGRGLTIGSKDDARFSQREQRVTGCHQIREVTQIEVVEEEEGEDSDDDSAAAHSRSHASGMEESPNRISSGVDRGFGEDTPFEEQRLLPLVCTYQNGVAYVIGLVDRDDFLILPTTAVEGILMQAPIIDRVKYLYADKFYFRLFPYFLLPKLRVEVDEVKSVRYTIVFIDARFPGNSWQGISSVGLGLFPFDALSLPSIDLLANVFVEHDV